MKKDSFAGMLYREFYLSRKTLLTSLIIFAGFALFALLALMSLYYGNIGKLLEFAQKESAGTVFPQSDDFFYHARRSLFLTLKILPAVFSLQLEIAGTDIAAKDCMTSWNRYLHCTPVTPFRYAAVKTAVNVLLTVGSFLFGNLYMFLIGLLSGEYLSYTEVSGFTAVLVIIMLFSFIGQTFIILLRNRDKGMLVSFGIIIIATWSAASAIQNTVPEGDETDTLLQAAEQLFPYTPLISAGLLAALFAAMYFIFKRREK